MKELIEALQIFYKVNKNAAYLSFKDRPGEIWVTVNHCDLDGDDLERLEELGWIYDDENDWFYKEF